MEIITLNEANRLKLYACLKKRMKKMMKMEKVMHEFKEKKLRSGSKKGPKVTSRKQAIAIALSEAKKKKK